jgi:uridine kinase
MNSQNGPRARAKNPPVIIGIAGGTGSGKTALVREVCVQLGPELVLAIAHDSYYRDLSHLALEDRANVNYDHPDALETAALVEDLGRLRAGEEVDIPVYDFATHTRRSGSRRLAPRPVVIVEGLHVLTDPSLRKMLDIKVFVDVDSDIRFIRRMLRDVTERARTSDAVVRQYLDSARPMHLEYVEPSRRYADVIVSNGDDIGAAVDQLLALIRKAAGRP